MAWITKLQDETAEEHFRRAMCEAGQKGPRFQKRWRQLPGRARRSCNRQGHLEQTVAVASPRSSYRMLGVTNSVCGCKALDGRS